MWYICIMQYYLAIQGSETLPCYNIDETLKHAEWKQSVTKYNVLCDSGYSPWGHKESDVTE